MKLGANFGVHEYKREVLSLPIARIQTSPNQTRRVFEQSALDELATSMERVGLLQPVTVRRLDRQRFELIAGERRLRAAKQLGWLYIDARVIEVEKKDAALFTIIENIQREDLNCFEEAECYRTLASNYGMTQEQIAYKVGKKQSTISNKLRLLRLSKDLREYLIASGLSERHFRAMLRLDDENIIWELAKEATESQMTVRRLEQRIAEIQAGAHSRPERKQNVTTLLRDNRIFVNAISETFRQIRASGVAAQLKQRDSEEGIVVEIFIPKL